MPNGTKTIPSCSQSHNPRPAGALGVLCLRPAQTICFSQCSNSVGHFVREGATSGGSRQQFDPATSVAVRRRFEPWCRRDPFTNYRTCVGGLFDFESGGRKAPHDYDDVYGWLGGWPDIQTTMAILTT
ncbi:hypothetical protein CERSUDRAFT_114177 [Gelatoporia subvermispora B]|uniref:Uncharacterized protein n=1 Tax=Ceriporiopsis subvermispora (strain B) TaxID=914234 RepID=M2PMD1_CERS8|nr:hypothetical protein CERSUDRAFT_114177 [Gelatoporia subvermispora B]